MQGPFVMLLVYMIVFVNIVCRCFWNFFFTFWTLCSLPGLPLVVVNGMP